MAVGAAVGIRENAASSIRRYFEAAADRLGLHPEMRRLLSVPFRELTVELPLRRDDDRLQLFRGYRVQHNGVRGPVIGPVRFQSGLEIDSLRATAESMTWRCAVASVPFGGAAGGIACDPVQLSRREFEQLTRRYAARIHHLLGIYQDVCAPGVNAGTEVMSWIGDEYSALRTGTLAAVLGKEAQAGGIPNRERIAGRALAALVIEAARDAGLPDSGLRAAVRSFDQSAYHAAQALAEIGCVIVAVSEERGGLRCSTGIDMGALAEHVRATGSLHGFEGAAENTEVHGLDCDVLVLAAPECSLNGASAGRVRAKLVVEASELVITPTAERSLANRGVLIVPDLVGAAATVLVANAEWSHNVQRLSWEEAPLQREIDRGLLRIYEQVLERSRRERTSMRVAAYSSAIERVARCERLRVA
jgi:glutamate dehydrogenase (NAD(P)+)